ncbi:MAG: MATE family efflux transporter [Erysipelotrichaceae bacterium]|nr:MATE family efflux transporter [Erysipelotrichaceae bacterium]
MENKTNISKVYNGLFLKHFVLNITNSLCSIASGYLAGNFLDNIGMSCNSLISPLNSFVLGISFIFSSSSEILCGKYMGKGDKESINQAFTNAIISSLVVGAVFTGLMFLFSKPVVLFLGANEEMLIPSSQYLQGYAIGVIAYMLLPIFTTFLHMENESRYATYSVVLLAGSYVALGYLFIVVLGWGYFGFGLTTAASNILVVLFLLIKIVMNKSQVALDLKTMSSKCLKELIILGMPTGASKALIGTRNLILNNILLATGGVVAMASKSVQGSIMSVADAFTSSLVQASIVLASVCIGEKNKKELLNLLKHVFVKVFFVMYIMIAIYMIFPVQICSIFTSDPACLEISKVATWLYMPSIIFESASNILFTMFNVFGYSKFVNANTFTHGFLIHVLFAYFTMNKLGAYSVFSGYIVCEIVTTLIIFVFICIKLKKFPTKVTELLLLPDSLDEGIKFNKTIKTFDEAMNLSRDVFEFCKDNNLSKKARTTVPVCIEEMTVNIFEHGYTKKEVKDKRVDVFVSIEGEEINIRIRDNSVPFNPSTRNTIFNPEDPCKNIGIRMISNLAKEMTYQNLFGFNNTIIKI